MEKELHFSIKKGVYCSWCAELMKKTLEQHFNLKEIRVDIMNEKLHLTSMKRISPMSVISFLKKRGYSLIVE